MEHSNISRRTLLKGATASVAGLSVLQVTGARAFAQAGGEVIPWLDQPPPNPVPDAVGNLLKWEELNSWYTPRDKFFWVQHYSPAEPGRSRLAARCLGSGCPSAHTDAGGPQATPPS